MEALKSLSKRVCVNIGDLTRYLESLDALSLVDSAPELRVRRKGLVTRIQVSPLWLQRERISLFLTLK